MVKNLGLSNDERDIPDDLWPYIQDPFYNCTIPRDWGIHLYWRVMAQRVVEDSSYAFYIRIATLKSGRRYLKEQARK